MEQQKISKNPSPPPSHPPENQSNHLNNHSFLTENHPLTPASDQAIEAFSRLSISQDPPHAKTPSFLSLPATLDVVPLTFGETQQQGLIGAHQNIMVGPGEMAFYSGGPFVDPPLQLKKYQRDDFCDNVNYCNCLHNKKTLSKNCNGHFPFLPSSHQSMPIVYNNQQKLSLQKMKGRLVSLAKDPIWSGDLNLKLEQGLCKEEVDMILSEVLNSFSYLMMNNFGGRFVKNLFMVCNENQRTRIIMVLVQFPFNLINICLDPYGARAMQHLLEMIKLPLQVSLLVSTLSLGAIPLACDPNGQHVIKYCIKHFPEEYNKHTFNALVNNFFRIATDKSGCCVIQSCVEHIHGETRDHLINQIKVNALELAVCPYGNYVVQHLLGMRIPEVTADLVKRFEGRFVGFSFNKYASNVVEKFLSESGEYHSAKIIVELLRDSSSSKLLLHPYGNYVIKAALAQSKEDVRQALLKLIQVNAVSMQYNPYGKKLLFWIDKMELRNA